MSVISDFHTAVFYDGTNKPADETQRLSIITFKTPKEKKGDSAYKKPQNICFSVPKLTLKTDPAIMTSAMQALFEDLQDAVIRKIVQDKLEEGTVNTVGISVHKDQLSFEACAKYAAEQAISGKLTKDAIGEWFDANMQEALEVALANAMKIGDKPTAEQVATLNAAVKQHRDLFAGCAATRPNVPVKIAKSLVSALKLVEDDRIKLSLSEKLEKLANPQDTKFFGL